MTQTEICEEFAFSKIAVYCINLYHTSGKAFSAFLQFHLRSLSGSVSKVPISVKLLGAFWNFSVLLLSSKKEDVYSD